MLSNHIIPKKDVVFNEENFLGQGGYGKVYQGEWSGQLVAIKTTLCQFNPSLEEEFRREIDLMLNLNAPQVVRTYGFLVEPTIAIVMELMPNGSLHSLLRKDKSLEWPTKYKIALDIAYGMKYLHDRNVLHRDLKSLNVLLDKDLTAKICDFGLAKVKNTSRSLSNVKPSGTICWMAPELFGRKSIFEKSSDIYALGMVFYEILTHKIPFEDDLVGKDHVVVQGWIQNKERPDLPDVAPELFSRLITECWTQERDLRPTAEKVVATLKPLVKIENSFSSSTASSPTSLASSPNYLPNTALTISREAQLKAEQEAEEINKKGNSLLKEAKYLEAISEYIKAIEVTKNDENKAKYFSNKGIALSRQNKHTEAIDEYTKAIELSKDYENKSKYLNNKGNALFNKGSYAEAIIEYNKAIEVTKNDESTIKYKKNLKDALSKQEEGRINAEREAKLKAEQDAKAKAEREAKLKAEQEAKAKAEREAKLKAEQDAKSYKKISHRELVNFFNQNDEMSSIFMVNTRSDFLEGSIIQSFGVGAIKLQAARFSPPQEDRNYLDGIETDFYLGISKEEAGLVVENINRVFSDVDEASYVVNWNVKKADTGNVMLQHIAIKNEIMLSKTFLDKIKTSLNCISINEPSLLKKWQIESGVELANILKKYKTEDIEQALRKAALGGNSEEVKQLIQSKANVDAQSVKNGKTALHHAVEYNHENCVEVLLSFNANKMLSDKNGKCSFNYVQENAIGNNIQRKLNKLS